jgi:hypothetical protein
MTVKLEVTPQQLLHAVEQLPAQQLTQFTSQVVRIRAKRLLPSLSLDESQLIKAINQTLPMHIQQKSEKLIQKRREELLMEAEYQMLLQLTAKSEKLQVTRAQAITDLAKLRNITVGELMRSMGISAKYE